MSFRAITIRFMIRTKLLKRCKIAKASVRSPKSERTTKKKDLTHKSKCVTSHSAHDIERHRDTPYRHNPGKSQQTDVREG